MKYKKTIGLALLLFIMLLLFALSCKKEANNNPQLIGKWTEVSATTGPGDRPVYFTVNTPGPAYVTFLDSGKIQTDLFINCVQYRVSGGKIVLTYDDTPTISNVNYSYSIHQDTLIMNNDNCPGCQVVLAKQ